MAPSHLEPSPPMNASVMLLAAGRSTRLGPLGLALPKPLVPICGYPAIAFGLRAAARAGRAPRGGQRVPPRRSGARRRWATAARWGSRIDYSVEAELLGTGGGIAHGARRCSDPGRRWS